MVGHKNHHQPNRNKPNKTHGNQFKNKNPFRNKFNRNFDGNRKQIQHEAATPWSELKQNFSPTNNVDSLEQDSQTTNDQKNIQDRQNVLKQRDASYRKFLIQEKQKEKPKWEKFGDISNDKSKKKINNVATPSTSSTSSSSMTFKEQNHYRKVVTKLTTMSKGVSLKSALNDLKRRGVKRNI